jgi:GxxExxY protein
MQDDDPLTFRINGCAYGVANDPSSGFLEKVYENALAHELRKTGLNVVQQHGLEVLSDGVKVGDDVADLRVEGQVLIELKTCKVLDDTHLAQCLNYLKATGLKVCLRMNLGRPKVQLRRQVMDQSGNDLEPVMNGDGQ